MHPGLGARYTVIDEALELSQRQRYCSISSALAVRGRLLSLLERNILQQARMISLKLRLEAF
jgi:hypothetical protein